MKESKVEKENVDTNIEKSFKCEKMNNMNNAGNLIKSFQKKRKVLKTTHINFSLSTEEVTINTEKKQIPRASLGVRLTNDIVVKCSLDLTGRTTPTFKNVSSCSTKNIYPKVIKDSTCNSSSHCNKPNYYISKRFPNSFQPSLISNNPKNSVSLRSNVSELKPSKSSSDLDIK